MRPEIKRKWKRKHQFKNDYIHGYLAGLQQKFIKQNKTESLDLVIVQDALVVQYFQALELVQAKMSQPQSAGDHQAWSSGYKDGQTFEQGKQMIT